MYQQDNQLATSTEPEFIEEVVVKLSNDGCSPKPTQEMRLSTEKSNCKGDYGCCGRLP